MSRIDELIAEHCPAGVPFKPLGEVGTFVRGNGLQKKDFVDDGFPCIHYGQIYTFYGTSTAVTKSFVAPELAARLKQAQTGDLVVTTTSENIDDVCTAVAWLGEGPIAIGGHSCVFKHTLDPMYAAYYFQTEQFELQKRKFVTGTKVKDIKISDIARVKIPVPPLAIQREIAAILDKMESLKAELEAELELRSRQYAFYRDSLLTFAERERVRWATLSEIATIGTGSHDTQDATPDGDYVFYARGRDPLRLGSFDFEEQAIITAGDGVGVGKVFHFADGKYALHQRAYRIVPGDEIEARYLYHYLISDFARYLERTSVHASVTSLRRPMFLKYPVPVPPLDEQQRVAAILDKFDALVNDLFIGLPAEIRARQAQYEYYRDKLLTFEELAA